MLKYVTVYDTAMIWIYDNDMIRMPGTVILQYPVQ